MTRYFKLCLKLVQTSSNNKTEINKSPGSIITFWITAGVVTWVGQHSANICVEFYKYFQQKVGYTFKKIINV